jgi:hypothetical protein
MADGNIMRFVISGLIRYLLICLAGLGVLGAQQSHYSVSEEPAGGPGSPPVVVIRDNNAGVEAAVTPSEGGELSSLRVKFRGAWVELMYRARDYKAAPGFRGKAMFLWPAVGAQYPSGTTPETSCADGSYLVAEGTYPMPCHGFAKGLAWREAGQTADAKGARVTVELRVRVRRSRFANFVCNRANLALSGAIVGKWIFAVLRQKRSSRP